MRSSRNTKCLSLWLCTINSKHLCNIGQTSFITREMRRTQSRSLIMGTWTLYQILILEQASFNSILDTTLNFRCQRSEMWNLRPNFVLRPPDQKASPPSRKCQIEGAPHHYVPLRCAADGDSIRRRHRGLTENMKIIDYCTWRKIHDHKVLPGRWRNLSFRRICSLGSDTRCTFIICHGFSALFSRFILLLEEDFCICKILASSKISIIHQFMNA